MDIGHGESGCEDGRRALDLPEIVQNWTVLAGGRRADRAQRYEVFGGQVLEEDVHFHDGVALEDRVT